MKQHDLVILGSGYTGRFLFPLAAQRYPSVFATSREPERRLAHLPADRRLHFDLMRRDTWPNIPASADLLWCFPAQPPESVQAVAAAIKAPARRLVVLGSTSAYDIGGSRDSPPQWIDETAPVDPCNPRVQGEEFLRRECGAIVLRVAGIYGPGRNPLDWIRLGRVGPSGKYVNLIHVEDLASICLAALAQGKPGEIYNVSDGVPRTWDEICKTAQERWSVAPAAGPRTDLPGKRIVARKVGTHLGVAIRHSDLYAALEFLERSNATSAGGP